jgi:hypothetical protein
LKSSNQRRNMQKKSVHKYCHVNAYVAYEEDDPIYKKSFKFHLKPGANAKSIWKKLVSILDRNGIEVELKS